MTDKPSYKFIPSIKSADKREVDRRDVDRRDVDRRDVDRRNVDRREPARFENQNQDPNHPANTTAARDLNAPVPSYALPPEAYMTEQEKAAMAEGAPGSKVPYPTGDPPPVHETVTRSQGIKGATDPKATPVDSSGPGAPMKKRTE